MILIKKNISARYIQHIWVEKKQVGFIFFKYKKLDYIQLHSYKSKPYLLHSPTLLSKIYIYIFFNYSIIISKNVLKIYIFLKNKKI